MKTKYLLLLLLVSGLITSFIPNTPTNTGFEPAVKQVIHAFREGDGQMLNDMLDPELGLTVIYRPGVLDYFTQLDTLDLDRTDAPRIPAYDQLPTADLQYATLPQFDCESLTWNQTGLFCDTTTIDRLWSRTAESINFQEIGNIPTEQIEAIKKLEDQSRRVVLADNEFKSLMFTLSLIDREWRLTCLDLVTDDCDL